MFSFVFLLHMHAVDLVGALTVLWKETKPKVILPSSSSGAGVWCLLIFQFDEHDKFIKIAFAVNHSGREEVLTTKPKDIFLILRLLWPINSMRRSTEYIQQTERFIIYIGVNYFYFSLFIFFILGPLKLCLNMRYK